MKLDAHLKSEGLNNAQFGRIVDASEATVSRLRNGKQVPSHDLMRRIMVATNNAVRPNDFFDIGEVESPVLAAGAA